MIPSQFRICRKIRESGDTYTLGLEPTNGGAEFSFFPGQFNMLYVFGVGEAPISISGDPAKQTTLIHTVRSVGNVTSALLRMGKDDVIGVRGPFGSHWPVEEAIGNDVILVAGGIGLAPLRPVLYSFITHRDKYGRIILLYGARTPEDLLYKKELERWRGRFDLEIKVTVDSATGDWHGNVGVVTTLIPRLQFDPLRTIAMLCGPEVMMRFTIKELQNCGVKNENIFVSMERNMKCGVCLCGHCQCGPKFVCKDGPVFCYDHIKELFGVREI